MKQDPNGNRILLDKKKMALLKMWQGVQMALDEVPREVRSNHHRMLQLEIKFTITDLKNSLYGEQTALTMISADRESG